MAYFGLYRSRQLPQVTSGIFSSRKAPGGARRPLGRHSAIASWPGHTLDMDGEWGIILHPEVVTAVKTQERKPFPKDPSSDAEGSGLHLCQVFPLYDDTGLPSTSAQVRGELTVGRDAGLDNRLQIFDYAASRAHFRLESTDGELHLSDLNSTNGTFVNGEQVNACRVGPQDVIRIADSIFVITEEAPASDREAEQSGTTVGSGATARAVAHVRKIAREKRCVLLLGETGTGKDVMVRLLHDFSGRSGKLVTVNCATIQEALLETTLFGCVEGAFTGSKESAGLVAEAHLGTLFLDEIGELPDHLQAKLLRFLETGEVLPVGASSPVIFDVRVAAATNRLSAETPARAALRQDLLGRLEDEVVRLTPLRSRREEIVPLMCRALRTRGVSPRKVLDPYTVECALRYDWPRNVRQLLKSTESALVHGVGRDNLSHHVFDELLTLQEAERAAQLLGPDSRPTAGALQDALSKSGGNVSEVARFFGCDRKQIYRWLKRYGIEGR